VHVLLLLLLFQEQATGGRCYACLLIWIVESEVMHSMHVCVLGVCSLITACLITPEVRPLTAYQGWTT